MDKVVSKIVDSMLDEQIISIEERGTYVYSLQMIIEKTIGYIAIFVLALAFDLFLPTVMFVIFLSYKKIFRWISVSAFLFMFSYINRYVYSYV